MFQVKDLSMIYDMNTDSVTYALKEINLTLPDKGLIGIIGPSGSGKSTLMYCLSTLREPTEGSIIYNGIELTLVTGKECERLRRTEFGFIFQKHYLVPYMSALDNVMVGATGSRNEVQEKASELLAELGLSKKEFVKKPARLSGGQCQRTAIARAMINDPKVVFADEPTASLDHENAFNVMRILKKYSEERLVMVITHDKSILADADLVMEIWDGELSK